MYKLTRQDVADRLNISTRSVDRYIKAGKLRAKKDGKIVYVKQGDVDNLMGGSKSKQEVIIKKKNKEIEHSQKIVKNLDENVAGTLGAIYKDLKEEIKNKDQLIQVLAMRVGKAEEIAKNSVSLLDFKKSQFLLEDSKVNLEKDLQGLASDKEKLKIELKYEKTSNIILIFFVLILLGIAGTIWFMEI
ncbi:MAG: helix-turn-helix domain-containing protein [Candidatus Gracilibacteria bacterium]